MNKDMLNSVLLVCVLVVLIAIAILLAGDSDTEVQVVEAGEHSHEDYVEASGDIITGDLVLENLHANGNLNGNGANLVNLNASQINSGTVAVARLPSDLDAGTLDGLDSLDFSLILHNHHTDYYTKSESDSRFSLLSHSHSPGDADTLDGLDSTYFAMAVHNHDSRYYNKTDSDGRFSSISHFHSPGDADTLDGYDSLDFAFSVHLHDASNITSGTLGEARLPQNSIDETEIEPGFGLVPSGAILMWSGETPPSGWALCDGTNGTPDLRGRFIVGYDPSDSDYNDTGNTGGEKDHTLTTSEMPMHQHSYSGITNQDGMHTHSYEDFYFDETQNGMTLEETSFETNGIRMQNKITNSDGLHDHTYSGDTTFVGSGQAHENRPPYYVLAFIMKL
jgi:microcystin-dependent protein